MMIHPGKKEQVYAIVGRLRLLQLRGDWFEIVHGVQGCCYWSRDVVRDEG